MKSKVDLLNYSVLFFLSIFICGKLKAHPSELNAVVLMVDEKLTFCELQQNTDIKLPFPQKIQGDTIIYSYREDEKYYIVWETNYFKIEYAGEPNSFTEFRIVDKDKLKTIIETKESVPYEGYSIKKYPINLLIKEGKSTDGEWGLCEYKNGLKHGKKIDYDESFVGGIRAIWEFENGIYKRLTAYYPNGYIWQKIIYDPSTTIDKIPESYYITEFYMEKKDVKKSEGKMIKPYIQDGKWLLYDINGRVEEKEYKNGDEVSK